MLVLQGHTNSVQALAYSSDGGTLYSAGDDRTIRLWDLRRGHQLAVLTGHADGILTIAVLADGEWLASGGHEKQVWLWSLPQQQLIEAFPRFASSVNAVAFEPRG